MIKSNLTPVAIKEYVVEHDCWGALEGRDRIRELQEVQDDTLLYTAESLDIVLSLLAECRVQLMCSLMNVEKVSELRSVVQKIDEVLA